jgi:hypothetical protein
MMALVGCSSNPVGSKQEKQVAVSASLKELGMGQSVTRVVLTVTSADFPAITSELAIVNGLVYAELEIPFGPARVFDLSAFNTDSVRLYHGVDTSDVSAGPITEVSIYMLPQVTMLKISPLYKLIGTPGRSGFFDIEIYNIDSLFGVALRVEIDSSILRFDSCKAGGFLGTPATTIFFYRLIPDRPDNLLPLAYSIRGNQQAQGVTGSGRIARVFYTARKAGKSALTIDASKAVLSDWRLEPLPRQGQLYIENGEVEVNAP